MAKNDKTTNGDTTLPFTIETVGAPAPIQRAVGGKQSPYVQVMTQLSVPVDGKYQSFFVPATISDNITDAGEKEKAFRDSQRRISNSISGASRRIEKKDASFKFATRQVVENGVYGVRVYRMEAPAVAAPAPTPAAAPAPAQNDGPQAA